MRIILASASPRRRELLTQIGLEFDIVVSDVEEKVSSTLPWQVVEELSCQKAEAVCELVLSNISSVRDESDAADIDAGDEVLIIGADTIVAFDKQILGKPNDMENAKEMIRSLQGRMHQVYTGVTLIHVKDGVKEVRTFHERTDVEFYPMTELDIEKYVHARDYSRRDAVSKWDKEFVTSECEDIVSKMVRDTDCIPYECEDKAGAYGIQGFCARYIKGIQGDYNNVVGLPVGRLYQEAKDIL